ncbi:ESCRT II complex subunit Dot2 [Dimargaris cristalligena]|uniref:Vacuolar-sorting protein SNF8 n=1 Tax=Dimargaris cristalligena TaxID=215637 RepID=A0A4Q0A2C0_9FUNG|nr:ESCRT II complex subunit Dot2 [Dimargaris cristalligena]RKP39482.1 EAP30/Vps36 family-domain-containing protein [Dimargaris cristalligena]|eukprot:RKP39482.1 EAP30/Vps36 family-domain-containing protein [Dimargaris cristalligena]
MSRRRVGLSRIHYEMSNKEHFREIGNNIAAVEVEQLQNQLAVFKTNLEEFAQKHQKKIRSNPAFRTQFQKMCQQIGVDPLASNKGFWADLLGFGDFYYELGIQIIEVCINSRHINGGLIAMDDLRRAVEVRRGARAQEINNDDIVQAIKNLAPLGSGFQIVEIGSQKMVQSIPREFNTDQSRILSISQLTGFTTITQVANETGWAPERIVTIMDMLLRDGLCWIDLQHSEPQYWFPTYFFSEYSKI